MQRQDLIFSSVECMNVLTFVMLARSSEAAIAVRRWIAALRNLAGQEGFAR